MFVTKQIIWAKTKGYPWWPAEINKLPTADHNYFKVTFVGQTNHALLQQKAIKKYMEHYDTLKTNNYKGLQNSIDMANNQLQKRKNIIDEAQSKVKNTKTAPQKNKRIKKNNRNNKRKPKTKENLLQQSKPLNEHFKSFHDEDQQKVEKKLGDQSSALKHSERKQGQIQSDIESVDLLQSEQSSQIELNELQYLKNVDRKKIESTEEELFVFITRFNSNIYEKEKECFQLIQKIESDEFRPQQLLQSKITNMITYIHKKLSERTCTTLKKEEVQKINKICNCLKQKVLKYLFDCCYYDQYLKKMEKNVPLPNQEKQEKQKSQSRSCPKNNRRYKRRVYPQRKKNS